MMEKFTVIQEMTHYNVRQQGGFLEIQDIS